MFKKQLFLNDKEKIAFFADSREIAVEAFEGKRMGVHWVRLGTSRGYEVIGISSNSAEFARMATGNFSDLCSTA